MSDNLTKEQRRELEKRAIAEAVRVSRDGGVGIVALPDPTTGRLTRLQLDQERARELLAWLTDTRMAEIWTEIRAGNTISAADRNALRKWTDATLAEAEDAERERRTMSKSRRAHLSLIEGGKP